jgi:hypothetical protein
LENLEKAFSRQLWVAKGVECIVRGSIAVRACCWWYPLGVSKWANVGVFI